MAIIRDLTGALFRWHSLLRQGGATLLLGSAIISGGFVPNEAPAADAFKSTPAKSGFMSCLHEVQVCEATIEPKASGAASDLVIAAVVRKVHPQIDVLNLENVGSNNGINAKGSGLPIDR